MRFLIFIAGLFTAALQVSAQSKTDWFNIDFKQNALAGAEVDEAIKLIGDRTLTPIVVAVIDDGVDIYHDDFEGKIWVNEDEIAGNGIDDDQNGFIDDVNGWNFLGNPDGENIKNETLELTRIYRKLSAKYEGKNVVELSRSEQKEYQAYLGYKKSFEEELESIKSQFNEYAQLATLYKAAQAYFLEESAQASTSLDAWRPSDEEGEQVKAFLQLAEKEDLAQYVEDAGDYFDRFLEYNLNPDFDPRDIVNEEELPVGYGNNMVWAENPAHGTHVAGIIAAKRGNDIGINGIAPNALIMPLRAVPAGDERDKDIALAIRYAVDNGAKIINMSFGKSYSPDRELVFDAMKYAIKQDVLLVHAAGNDASDNDVVINYPDGTLGKKKSAKSLLTIAANSIKPGTTILADFSNYGKNSVDLFAPGVEIKSLAPENKVKSQSGTSMAAPVVSGVAALVWGVNPDLSAKRLKSILVDSSNQLQEVKVIVAQEVVDLENVIRYPAVISAANAVREAMD